MKKEGETLREKDRIAKDGETVYLRSTNWVRISWGCDFSGVERIFTSKEEVENEDNEVKRKNETKGGKKKEKNDRNGVIEMKNDEQR